MPCLGLDTSNYTTSAAVFDGTDGANAGRLLPVAEGELGLRQSDALFHHVRRLPEIVDALRQQGVLKGIEAVGASTRPRAVEGSYMPCFLAGASMGQVLAQVLDVPFAEVSHQQGHLAAAAWSAGHMELLDTDFLAWHLSGGTTELLLVRPEGANVSAEILGGTSDLSAGQLIDRAGKLLGLAFPAGKALDELSDRAERDDSFRVRVRERVFSLSGMENKIRRAVDDGAKPEDAARLTLNIVVSAVEQATCQAKELYPGLPVLFSGGVASNSLLRRKFGSLPGTFFAEPRYSTDNAMGVAVLTHRMLKAGVL